MAATLIDFSKEYTTSDFCGVGAELQRPYRMITIQYDNNYTGQSKLYEWEGNIKRGGKRGTGEWYYG
jgi:hypothetical protein